MIKQRLINKRIERKFTQEDISDSLDITQSQYSRRESGNIRISKKEWNTLAKILETTIEEIYEPQDGVYIINNKNGNAEYSENQNHSYNLPDKLIELYEAILREKDKRIEQMQATLQKKDETITYLRSKE